MNKPMKQHRPARDPRVLAATLGALLALGACDDLLGGTDGGVKDDGFVPAESGPKPDTGAPPTGVVVTKKAGETAEADFTKGTEQFLVVPYSVSSVAADALDFDITLSGGSGTTSVTTHKLRMARRPLRERNPALWARWQLRLQVERWTRQQAVKAAASRLVPLPGDEPRPIVGCTKSSACKATEVCHQGSCASSLTLDVSEFSTSKTATMAVKLKGTKAALLVDTKDTVSTSAAQAILDKFQKVIHPRAVALFGDPSLKGAPASDRNGDGLVWLVLTSKVADKMTAVGFFNAVDFSDAKASSNKADILYINSAETKSLANIYPIMAHELQHLLNFASKKYKPTVEGGTGSLEALWLDEGQAHFAEDACGFGGETVTLLDQEIFTGFGDYPVFSSKDSSGMRGMAMLFVRYLFEQKGGVSYSSSGVTDKGGAAFLKQLHTTSKQGTAAVDQIFGDHKAMFDTWMAAMALDGRGVTSYSRYVYAPLVTDPVTGTKIGLKVRGTRKDNTGASVTLQGPLEEDLSSGTNDSVANASGKFFLLKGKSGKVKVKVTTTEKDFRFALIKIK